MARAYTTKFRSYVDIKDAVDTARELSSLRDSIDFSLTDYIDGPLTDYLRGRLNVSLVTENYMSHPAKVDLKERQKSIELYVKERVWDGSRRGFAESRFILAHEIGHIWLHRDDEFGFSDEGEGLLRFSENEYFVEYQANIFADLFLLTDGAVKSFDTAESLFDYCDYYAGVPLASIKRRFATVQRAASHHFGPKYDVAVICRKCGGNRIASVLNFTKCDDCSDIRY